MSMFGRNKNGYVVVKHTTTDDKKKCVWHLNMRDDNIVFVTNGYNIISGRVHMAAEEAEIEYAKNCASLGIGEAVE